MPLNCGAGKDSWSPLDCKEIQPVHPKRDQSWVCIGRTDAEAETPILWLLNVKNWLIGKDSDSGKDWRQEEKRTTEQWDGWMASQTNGHEFEKLYKLMMDREAWCAAVRGVTNSQTWLSDWTELNWWTWCFCIPKIHILSLLFPMWKYLEVGPLGVIWS